MQIKKYKVVCSQPKFSEQIYIDIAPDSGVIHDQIFYSRIMLHKQVSQEPLSRLYGSIYLEDNEGKISVEFPKPQVRKDSPDYEGIMRQYAALEPKIIRCYEEMKQSEKESTLFLYSINQMRELSKTKNAEADVFEKRRREKMQKIANETGGYMQKHAEQIGAQTPQEEQRMRYAEEFSAIQKRRIVSEQKRAQESITAWQRFQKQYSGD